MEAIQTPLWGSVIKGGNLHLKFTLSETMSTCSSLLALVPYNYTCNYNYFISLPFAIPCRSPCKPAHQMIHLNRQYKLHLGSIGLHFKVSLLISGSESCCSDISDLYAMITGLRLFPILFFQPCLPTNISKLERLTISSDHRASPAGHSADPQLWCWPPRANVFPEVLNGSFSPFKI